MAHMTRRTFVQGALVAGLGGGAGRPLLGCGSTEAKAAGLRKCISMGSINHGGDPQDLTAYDNLARVRETGARWVRIWIRWDKAQPLPATQLPTSALGDPANDLPECGPGCGVRYLQAVDAQVDGARAAGLNVILATWQFPRWANGTEGLPAEAGGKGMEYRVPIGQLGPEGHYGRWIDWLIGRYAHHGRRLVLEIMNEPNHQLWPQEGIAAQVAEMMATAAAVSAARGHPVMLAGPGASDRRGSDNRLMTSYGTFAPQVLDRLDELGFPRTPSFVWSHHNYSDVERDETLGCEQVRTALAGRWRGRGGPADPRIWLTEGGARLGSGEATDLARQAELVRRSWRRMSRLRGVELWTNYLLHTDPHADSGLRESRESGDAPRPVWDVFRDFPGVA
ncbi:MAG: cellulase family glycosylhydrolase [Thermoleophilaceae bacterium]